MTISSIPAKVYAIPKSINFAPDNFVTPLITGIAEVEKISKKIK